MLLLAGALDVSLPQPAAVEYAGLLPQARLVVQPGSGHAPRLDDPERLLAATTAFLATTPARNPA
ncbi:alpha/beta fold hydrolase [Streptomyces katrae]|uniref:alpha/beta fold hydrolase n=1 Tax=Streptomyces katrae TaxID=68223 RepID=UPI0004BE6760|nr:hypothetical protein [Streptomyces katrae]